jgi:hypothetical protein
MKKKRERSILKVHYLTCIASCVRSLLFFVRPFFFLSPITWNIVREKKSERKDTLIVIDMETSPLTDT